jgi:hypothetical protein
MGFRVFGERKALDILCLLLGLSPCSGLPRFAATEGALSLSLMIKKQTIKAWI